MRTRIRRIPLLLAVATAFAMVLPAVSSPPAATAATPILPAPDPDPFYAAPPDLAAHHNGDILRVRQVNIGRYGPANGWQILFRSTNSQGSPIAATTTLMVPFGTVAHRPLLSYQAMINSLGLQCAPSHELLRGTVQEGPALTAMLLRGWAVAVPDHLGPESEYGAARLGGQIVLDGIRAAEELPQAGLRGSPIGLAGYSGGAMATAWADALAPSYAPDLHIVGVAAGGVPANMIDMARALGVAPHPLFGLGFAAAIGLERAYPQQVPLSSQLNPKGVALRDEMANMCTQQIIDVGANKDAQQLSTTTDPLASPSARAVLAENSLEYYPGAPTAPTFIWQGGSDVLVPVGAVDRTVAHWCQAGDRVNYLRLPGLDHGPAGVVGLPQAIAYMEGRFDGAPPPSTC